MLKSKKSVMIAMLVFVMTAGMMMAGCGSDDDDPNTIIFWNPLTGEDGEIMNEIVDAYNETDPEYPVKAVVTSDMYTKIYAVANTGTGVPDLALIHAERVPGFVKQGMLEDVEGLMEYESDLNASNYLDQAWDAGTVDGTQYTIPLDIHGNVCYYNYDLLEKYNVTHWLDDDVITFDEMKELAGQLDDDEYILNDVFMHYLVFSQVINLGGDLADEDGNPTIDTDEFREAIELYKELEELGLMTPYGEDSYSMFQSGQVFFSTDGTWSSLAHSEVEGINLGVTNIYSISEDTVTNISSSHTFALLTNEDRTDEKEEGIAAFLNWLRENSLDWAAAGQIPASLEALEDDSFTEENYMQAYFMRDETASEAIYVVPHEYYSYIADAVDNQVRDMVYGVISIDEGLATAQKEVEDKVAENYSSELEAAEEIDVDNLDEEDE